MQKTQINIYNGQKQFRYGIEYIDNVESIASTYFNYTRTGFDLFGGDTFQFINDFKGVLNVKRNTNKWNTFTSSDTQLHEYIPEWIDLSSFNVYFPTYSVETYTGNWLYAVSAYTYINGDKIILNESVIDRRNALAYDGKKIMHNIRYSEFITINIINPWSLAYSDDWAHFRHHVCGEPEHINNTGSLLTIEIHPIPTSSVEGEYLKLDNYVGGMNSLMLSDNSLVDLTTNIEFQSPSTINLTFNYNTDLYSDSSSGLDEYISETYKLGESIDIQARSRLTLFDNSNIYNLYMPISESLELTQFDLRSLNPDTRLSTIEFESWDEFLPGLQLRAVTELLNGDEPLLTLTSNTIYMDQDLYATIMMNEPPVDLEDVMEQFENDPNTINFNGEDMETINIVNKTQKKVINIEKPNDFKNNLTRPVFIRTQKNDEITIHPMVTENISINLREYKNYVDTFTLRICGVDFVEYGRQSSNIIFKVVGKYLPEELENGYYYILDDNSELVTTGKYIIE